MTSAATFHVAVDGTPVRAVNDLLGVKVQGFQVVDQAPRPRTIRHTCWWLRCDACAAERWETSNTIRRTARGRFVIWCRTCGALEPKA